MSNYFEDIAVYEINTAKRHAAGFPYDVEGKKKIQSLNGMWKFKYCRSVNDIPSGYYAPDYDLSGFDNLRVPSNWQIEGYGRPQYLNIRYPKPLESGLLAKLPRIHKDIAPVGLYVTEFNYTPSSDNVYVNFGGINSAGEVYINGKFAGYSEDSFDCQEYDLTEYLKEGVNRLAVTVYQFSTGSYLEDQDMWRLSGIFRDVNLVFYPKKLISDVHNFCGLSADLAVADFNAELSITAERADYEGGQLVVKLRDAERNEVFTDMVNIPELKNGETYKLKFKKEVENPELWDIDTPYLYEVDYILYEGGAVADRRKLMFGFRTIEITPYNPETKRGPFIMFNRKPLRFRGVNRHEFDPERGHAVTREFNESDIILCRQNNITAIRTSHYPDSRDFYELCDKYGVVVMCECNLETHSLAMRIPSSDPKWEGHCRYRMRNMVETYKNYTSIVMWSLGNEAGIGENFAKMKEEALKFDKTRPIHYEPDSKIKVSDVMSEMYTKQETMKRIGENKPHVHSRALWNLGAGYYLKPEDYTNKPYILCEYAHCMNNSLGNFADYWKDFLKYDRLAGGFIWDFADQSIKKVESDGTVKWTQGGDWGDTPNDGNFVFNGIVQADRSPNPALFEVKKVYQMVQFALDGDELVLSNRYRSHSLDEKFLLTVRVLHDGKFIEKVKLALPEIKPYEKGRVNIRKLVKDKDGEVSLVFELALKEDTFYAPAGHIAAYEQFLLNPKKGKPEANKIRPVYENLKDEIRVYCEEVEISIDKKTGGMNFFEKDKPLLNKPVMPNFWRAITDNDFLPQIPKSTRWFLGKFFYKNATKRIKPKKIYYSEPEGCLKVEIYWKQWRLPKLKTTYKFDGCGNVLMSMSVKGLFFGLPRYGFTMQLADGYERMKFYGNGPFENYCDRNTAAMLAVFDGKPEEFGHMYLTPQECSNHTEMRWLELYGNNAPRFKAEYCGKPFEASVYPYTIEELDNTTHRHLLHKCDGLTVNLDGKQRGVGGDVPAVACTKPRYKIPPLITHNFSVGVKFEPKK